MKYKTIKQMCIKFLNHILYNWFENPSYFIPKMKQVTALIGVILLLSCTEEKSLHDPDLPGDSFSQSFRRRMYFKQ